jgi:y4mF family transcriptional regulator
MEIKDFIREQRRIHRMTQSDLAQKAGVGLRFIRELEQGKPTLRMDKVNQVLQLFGKTLGTTDWRPPAEEAEEDGKEKRR